MESTHKFQELDSKQRLILCVKLFQSYLKQLDINLTKWKLVINILNEINSNKYLDEWFYKYCEILPNSILENNEQEFTLDKFEYISLNEFKELKYLYNNSKIIAKMNQIFKLIHEIGSIEMYSNPRAVFQHSIIPFKKITDLIN